MLSVRLMAFATVLAGAACADKPQGPVLPPPGPGITAYVTVDNLHALPGQTVRVSVEVRSGTAGLKVGSYTGRLKFDPAGLTFKREIAMTDGLRVANANNAGLGDIRFAGANATGFTSTTLYSAEFTVKSADYAAKLTLQMQELSAARTLQNLTSQLRLAPQVYLVPVTVKP